VVSVTEPYGFNIGFLDRINESAETLTECSKETDLERNVEKTKYMLLSR
jgi:hypothetical protein